MRVSPRQAWVGLSSLSLAAFLLILAGCSLVPSGLFLPPPQQRAQGQAQVDAPQCKEALPPGQAQREAAEALQADPEAQELTQALQELGKTPVPQRADGCKVEIPAEEVSGQGLLALQADSSTSGGLEATLVEVPAGPDAALYILKSETGVPDDRNVWAVVHEPAEDGEGERLLHLEPGLEMEPGAGPEVQALGADTGVGVMELLLPQGEALQEIAEGVKGYLEAGTVTSAGVWGLQVEALDWEQAQVVLDEGSKVVLEDGSEELEALIVVPEKGSEAGADAQQLWDRNRGLSFDPRRAVFATLKVKRVLKEAQQATSGKRYRYEVTSPPRQVKRGSELRFRPFDQCPFQFNRKTLAFRKPLCEYWERKAAPKVRERTFKRSLHVAPKVSKLAKGSSKSAVIGLAGPKGGLILVSSKEISPDRLEQIYERATSLPSVEGTQASTFTEVLKTLLVRYGVSAGAAGFVAAMAADLLQILIDMKPQRISLAQGLDHAVSSSLSGTINNLRDAHSTCTAGRKKAPEACAVNDFLEKIADFLVKYNFSDPANSFKEAIEMVARFIFDFASQDLKSTMKFLIQEFGPLAPFVYTQLKNVDPELIESWVAPYLWSAQPCAEEREKAEESGEFPPIIQDPLSCLLWMIGRFSTKGVKGMDQLMGYLAAMAYIANNGDTDLRTNIGVEGIARVALLVYEFLPRLRDHGWSNMWVEVGGNCEDICFHASKVVIPYQEDAFCSNANPRVCYHSLDIWGFLEPSLDQDEVNRIWAQIEKLAKILNFQYVSANLDVSGVRFAIIQFVNQFDPAAREDLCRQVANTTFSFVPVIVISTNGTVLCYSQNTDPDEIRFICLQLGLHCQIPDDAHPSNYSESESQEQSNSTSPSSTPSGSSTVVTPISIPEDIACKGKFCLM